MGLSPWPVRAVSPNVPVLGYDVRAVDGVGAEMASDVSDAGAKLEC